MAKRYAKEIHAFIYENYKGVTIRHLAELTSVTFGIDFTYSAMRSYLKNHKLSTGARSEPLKGYSNTFSKEVQSYIKANYKGNGPAIMTKLVNERFNTNYKHSQLKAYYANHKLNSGTTGKWEKGRISELKGKKWADFMSKEAQERSRTTLFKKGSKPHNALKVGDIVHTTEGYLVRKKQEPDVWEYLHRVVWQEHNGEIPDNMLVEFKDGNKDNINIDNLMLCTRAEHLELNISRLRFQEAALTETGLNVVKLKIKARERRNRHKQEHKEGGKE